MSDITTFLPIPPQHELLDFLHYDPDTGVVTYTKDRNSRARVGTVIKGSQIRINGTPYEISRVIWMMVTGEDPVVIVDHHDGDHSNNRWVNLRLATSQQNNTNRKTRKNSLTGLKGVWERRYKSGTVYEACTRVGEKWYYLGRFPTPEEASAAYNAATEKLHGDFSVTRRPVTT